jgi:hypothetical protein
MRATSPQSLLFRPGVNLAVGFVAWCDLVVISSPHPYLRSGAGSGRSPG